MNTMKRKYFAPGSNSPSQSVPAIRLLELASWLILGWRITLEEKDNKIACRSNLSLKAYLVIKMGNEVVDYLNDGIEQR